MTSLSKRLLLLAGLCLITLSFLMGKILLSTSLSTLERTSQLSVTYAEASVNPFTGTALLTDVSITRPLPDFVDAKIPTLSLDINVVHTLRNSLQFTSVDLDGLSGRIISNNIAIPFSFSEVTLTNFFPDQLVDGILFNSSIIGHIWESSIAISSHNMTISSLPIEQLNTLLDSPITGFKSGLLSITTLKDWKVDGSRHHSPLQIRLSGHKAEVPKSLSALEKLVASQLVAYVNRQRSLSFQAPIVLDRASFNGDIDHDFSHLFETIGSSMIESLPSQLANVKGSRHVNKNPLNLSDKHIQSIQQKLQSFLSE